MKKVRQYHLQVLQMILNDDLDSPYFHSNREYGIEILHKYLDEQYKKDYRGKKERKDAYKA